MAELFLASSFKDVAEHFMSFSNQDIKGKTVSFIPTASIPESIKFYVSQGRKALEKLGLLVDTIELTNSPAEDIAKRLCDNDYIYVTGGNTFYLLQELKRTGADRLIVEQIVNGKIYIGESAGAIIMAPNIGYIKEMDDFKKAPMLDCFDALHVVDFYPLPHHTNFPFKKVTERIITKYGFELNLIPITNKQSIVVSGGNYTVIGK